MVVAVASASLAPKVRASPVHRAMHPRPHAAMVHKAHLALKARATAAVKVAAMVGAQSHAAMCVLTTGVTAKVVPHHGAHVQKAVGRAVARTVADKAVAKSVANTMATNCRATLTL